MDFNKIIDDIIFKYNLDSFYPCYRKMRKAEKYIHIWMEECLKRVEESGKILCIASCNEEADRFDFYTLQDKHFEYFIGNNGLQNIEWEKYQEVYIVSYQEKEQLSKQLTLNGVPFSWIYDLFTTYGEHFDKEFYDFLTECSLDKEYDYYTKDNNYFLELFFLKRKYKSSAITKEEFLKRIFFLSIVFKDFLLAEKYYQEILGCMDKDLKTDYIQAYAEIKNVLQEMRKSLLQRNKGKNDIVMVWLDQMKYGLEKDMPYLAEEMKEGVYFDHAYTVIPYTIPTFRVLFTDEKEITIGLHSHKKIYKQESLLIQEMERRGYVFKVISGYIGNIEREWQCEEYFDKWAPMSLLCWNFLCCLVNSEESVFAVVHEMSHTHTPYFTNQMNEEMAGNSKESVQKRHAHAMNETDQCLGYYMNFLSEDTTKIYMSDHGLGEPWEHVHTLFAVTSKKIGKGRISDVFSYLNFDRLARQLMEDRFSSAEFVGENAPICSMPLYNYELIKARLRSKRLEIREIGYQGMVNKDYIYLKYNNQREVLLDQNHLPHKIYAIPHPSDICNADKVQYFRSNINKCNVDFQSEKFKYSKYLLKVFDNLERSQRNQLDYINAWIVASGKERIAIRMGGEHSYTLYEWLTEDNREKIVGFIDENSECICKAFRKKIIPMEKISEEEIDCVILSSFEHLNFIREEATAYPKGIGVFDMYNYLQEKGFPFRDIQCDLVGMSDSEYDVGFPKI
ncbi:MAG: LTA synthase family protein [Lachnospiraceae bacterium]|nr:LTA synthase family protein [Lachnospiraceae bacterium]